MLDWLLHRDRKNKREQSLPKGEKYIRNGIRCVIVNDGGAEEIILTGVNSDVSEPRIPPVIRSLQLKRISDDAFAGGKNVLSIGLPDTIEEIGDRAFEDSNFRNGSLPKNLRSMGVACFRKCFLMREMHMPSGIRRIEEETFAECPLLGLVDLPPDLEYIGNGAFRKCIRFSTIDIPDSVTYIGDRAFLGCDSLFELTLGSNVETIGRFAFKGCPSLSHVVFPASLRNLGEGAFDHPFCRDDGTEMTDALELAGQEFTLDSVTGKYYPGKGRIPEDTGIVPHSVGEEFKVNGATYRVTKGSTETEPAQAELFEYVGNPYKLIIPATVNGCRVVSISNSPFILTNGIGHLVISEGIMALRANALLYCSASKVELPESLLMIDDSAFENAGVEEIVIPRSVMYLGHYCFKNCEKLRKVRIDAELEKIPGFTFQGCCELEECNIPESVEVIESFAFTGCVRLDLPKMPQNLKSIEEAAFSESGIKKMRIPEGQTSIGALTFWKCSKLTGVEIPRTVTEIGKGAFSECTSLRFLDVPESVHTIGESAFSESGIVSVKLPAGLRSIPDRLFYGCKDLKNVYIPPTVTSIGFWAFAYCGFDEITFPDYPSDISCFVFAETICDSFGDTVCITNLSGKTLRHDKRLNRYYLERRY